MVCSVASISYISQICMLAQTEYTQWFQLGLKKIATEDFR